ncbi:tyrosine-protein kinase family protein, partial [Klebsiella pneumoniae]|uniref:tyrosine-protein kinase family protein n=1 Tax=Klebsiella pneumoniae TaxID=573 RepID=UPI002752E78D|nr:hypothetical protein [Klebsiella pneumoniae]
TNKTIVDNLYAITPGDIPPNPAELIMSSRFTKLMDTLKAHYDFIIIDSAPVGLVADGMEIMKYSDANLFMVRQDHS